MQFELHRFRNLSEAHAERYDLLGRQVRGDHAQLLRQVVDSAVDETETVLLVISVQEQLDVVSDAGGVGKAAD